MFDAEYPRPSRAVSRDQFDAGWPNHEHRICPLFEWAVPKQDGRIRLRDAGQALRSWLVGSRGELRPRSRTRRKTEQEDSDCETQGTPQEPGVAPNVKHQRARATASRVTERSRCARSAACASSTALLVMQGTCEWESLGSKKWPRTDGEVGAGSSGGPRHDTPEEEFDILGRRVCLPADLRTGVSKGVLYDWKNAR